MLPVVKVNNKYTMLYLLLILNTFSRLIFFFIVNFEHVFVGCAQDKIHKTT